MDWPTERITFLQGIVIVSFSSYSGLNLPVSSLTAIHLLNTIPVTLPSSLKISLGPQPPLTIIPSDSASSISSGEAGIISLVSRETCVTLPSPHLSAVLDTSIATFPPPITTVSPSNL